MVWAAPNGLQPGRPVSGALPRRAVHPHRRRPHVDGPEMTMASGENCYWRVGWGAASPRPPEGLPHASPGAAPDGVRFGSVEGCPRRGRAVPGRRDAARAPACKIVGDHVELMIVGHFTVTKHIQTTQEDQRQRAFAVAKPAGNRCYPRTTTTTVREFLDSESSALSIGKLSLVTRWPPLRLPPCAGVGVAGECSGVVGRDEHFSANWCGIARR